MKYWSRLKRALGAAQSAWQDESKSGASPRATSPVENLPAFPSERGADRTVPAAFRKPPRLPENRDWSVPRDGPYRIYRAIEGHELPPAPTSALGVLAKRCNHLLQETFSEVFAATLPLQRQLHWWWLHSTTDGHFTHASGKRTRYSAVDFTFTVFWFRREPVVVVRHRAGERKNKDGSMPIVVITRMILPADLFTLEQTYTLTPALTSEIRSYMAGAL